MEKNITAEYEVRDILGLALVLAVTGITIAYTQDVTADQRDTFTASTLERNATENAMQGVANLSKKLPTIGLVIGAVVIVGLLIAGFGRYMR